MSKKSKPRFKPAEFLQVHEENQQGDVPIPDLPFYKWMTEQRTPPERFVTALKGFYEGHDIVGAFSEKEIARYKMVYEHFWWVRNRISNQSKTK